MATETRTRARIAHAMAGRLRLRFERGTDVAEAARRLESALAGVAGILAVEARPAARSVVILYSPVQVEVRRLVEEVLPGAVELMQPGALAPVSPAAETTLGSGMVRAAVSANEGIARASRGFLDLRDIFPLTLIGLGLRRVAEGGVQPVPWYNLLYYGYSTFSALHGRRQALPNAVEIARHRFARGELTRDEYRQIIAELESSPAPAETTLTPGPSPSAR